MLHSVYQLVAKCDHQLFGDWSGFINAIWLCFHMEHWIWQTCRALHQTSCLVHCEYKYKQIHRSDPPLKRYWALNFCQQFWKRSLHLHTDCLHTCQQTLTWIFQSQSVCLHFLTTHMPAAQWDVRRPVWYQGIFCFQIRSFLYSHSDVSADRTFQERNSSYSNMRPVLGSRHGTEPRGKQRGSWRFTIWLVVSTFAD